MSDNITEDPYEKKNLMNEKPKIVKALRKRLAQVKKQIRPAGTVEELPEDAIIYGKEENREPLPDWLKKN